MAKRAIYGNDALHTTSKYSSNSPATKTVGGITVGTTLTGQTIEYLLQEILAPYIEPTFSSFSVNITPQPFEVGCVISGTKTFSWCISNDNIIPNKIGILNVTSGTTLATGLNNDKSESIIIPALENSSCCVWNWRITGCSTQDTAFSRNAYNCSVYPYFWGVETSGTRPTASNALVAGGNKIVNSVASSVGITFNSSGQWTWFAIPAICDSRTKWFQGAAPNCGDIAVAPTDKYPDEQPVSVTSLDGCWSGVNYNVYISGSAGTDGSTPIQFRTY